MNVARIFFLLFLLLAAGGSQGQGWAADAAGTSARPWPTVRFEMLSEPFVPAISMITDQRISVAGSYLGEDRMLRRWGLGYSVKAIVPFQYHASGVIRGDLDFGMNWFVRGDPLTDELFGTVWRKYSGSASLMLGELDIGRDSSAWRLKTINVGINLKQAIPYSMKVAALLPWKDRAMGVTPLVVSVAAKRIFNSEPVDSSDNRLDLNAHWQIPLHYGFYFFPQVEAYWQDKFRPRAYFNGEFQLVLGESVLKNLAGTLEPVVFVRYVDGRQSPNYVLVHGWEFGGGAMFTFH